MNTVHSCATTLLNSSLRCFIPALRLGLEKQIVSTWRSYRLICRLRIKPEYGSHFARRQKQLAQITLYFSCLPNATSECFIWRNVYFCIRYKWTAVDRNCLTVHKFTKSHNELSSSCRYLSDDHVAETRKTVSKKMGEIKENVLTIPNGLCLLRMVSTPFLGYLVLQEWLMVTLLVIIPANSP